MAKKSTHVEYDGSNDRDALAVSLQKAINARQKDGIKTSYFLDEHDDPSAIPDWISTGSTILDLAVSNRANGGLPVGRIIELNGLESTGKSLICAHICAETQKKGGLAVVIDAENSAAPQFWSSLGVNLRNLNYNQSLCIEDMFDTLEFMIGHVRKENPDRLLTIIFDSVAGAPTKVELEGGYGGEGSYGTEKAKIVSRALRKLTGLIGRQKVLPIFTNQLRMNLKAMSFGDQYIVPAGKALQYHASVRIRLKNIGRISDSKKMVIGNTIQAQVTKNRCGPPFRTAAFDVHFDSGIQDLVSLLDFMKDNGYITGTKAGYTFKGKDTELKFNTDKFVELYNTDKAFKDAIYNTVCERYVMKYRQPNSKIVDDVVHDEGDDEAEQPKEVVDE